MSDRKIALRNLHIAIFLFGITAILGDLIQLSAYMIVWWRVLITSISLLFFIKLSNLKKLSRQQVSYFILIGIIIGVHWLTFYGAVKLANASIALVCFATTSFFASILEPLIIKRKIKGFEVLLGLLMVPGMWLILNGTNIDAGLGMLVGIISAFLAALFSTLNKKVVNDADPLEITFVELGSAWLFLTLLFPFVQMSNESVGIFWPNSMDWLYLMILALLCTTLAYVLALKALKHISAFLANLSLNLEPVYGIILAWLILGESKDFTANFFYGCLIIVSSIAIYPILNKRKKQRSKL